MTPDKIAEQLRQDASAYSQGFADGYRLAKKALITCKDCKFRRLIGSVWKCQNVFVMMLCDPDDYCSRAERKEE